MYAVRARLNSSYESYPDFLSPTGYLTEEEKMIIDTLDTESKQHKTWVPVLWACERAEQARKDGYLSDFGQRAIMGEMLTLRGCCGSLMGWNEYNVPLVYTQVTPYPPAHFHVI